MTASPRGEAEHLRRVPVVHHDREIALGVDDQPGLALGQLGERPRPGQAPAVHDQDVAGGDAGGIQVELGGVQLHVPVAVRRRDPGAHGPVRHHRARHVQTDQGAGVHGRAHLLELHPGRQMGGRGREHVPAVERPRHGREHDIGVLDLHGRLHAAERLPGEGQQAVVRADEDRRARGRRHRAPIRPDARIDDRDVDRVLRHVRDGSGQLDGSPQHVLARDRVRDVDDARVRRDLRHDAVTDAHERVAVSVVGQEHDRTGHPYPDPGPTGR